MDNLSIQKLNGILDEFESVAENEEAKFKRIAERVKAIARNNFTDKSNPIPDVNNLIERVRKHGLRKWHLEEFKGTVQIMIDEIEHKEQLAQTTPIHSIQSQTYLDKSTIKSDNLKVFIVHGHNDAMKEATARTLEKLGLKPIILHEKANSGDTIIEKFSRLSDVGFAVVLLSADDYGYAKSDDPANKKLRARQNVYFELGFFMAKLERKHVVAIYEDEKNFEIPSDISGVIYIPYNQGGAWRFDLMKELRHAGYQVDANALIK